MAPDNHLNKGFSPLASQFLGSFWRNLSLSIDWQFVFECYWPLIGVEKRLGGSLQTLWLNWCHLRNFHIRSPFLTSHSKFFTNPGWNWPSVPGRKQLWVRGIYSPQQLAKSRTIRRLPALPLTQPWGIRFGKRKISRSSPSSIGTDTFDDSDGSWPALF